MRQFPREIEADLLFRGVDIFDWHRGQMSSRRLLVLIHAISADPNSTFSRERRDGDWSEEEYLRAAQVNETRLLRADQAAIHVGKKMDVQMAESPAQRIASEELTDRHQEVRNHFLTQLRGEG